MAWSQSVERLIAELGRLPGIGPKTAERLANHILQSRTEDALRLAQAIREVKEQVRPCPRCCNLTDGPLCDICSDARRDQTILCIVEQPRDLAAIERSGAYRGLYHVLGGRLAPLEGITPDKLTIPALIDRVREGIIKEVIMATNPTLEGDGTALYLSNLLADHGVRVTRLARGLATGSGLEFANNQMLADALAGRRGM